MRKIIIPVLVLLFVGLSVWAYFRPTGASAAFEQQIVFDDELQSEYRNWGASFRTNYTKKAVSGNAIRLKIKASNTGLLLLEGTGGFERIALDVYPVADTITIVGFDENYARTFATEVQVSRKVWQHLEINVQPSDMLFITGEDNDLYYIDNVSLVSGSPTRPPEETPEPTAAPPTAEPTTVPPTPTLVVEPTDVPTEEPTPAPTEPPVEPTPQPTTEPTPVPPGNVCAPEFYSGVNVAWMNGGYGADFATIEEWGQHTYDPAAAEAMFAELSNSGVNIVRWWVFADGRGAPEFDRNGYVIGIDQNLLPSMASAVEIASQYGVQIQFNLWSFDMTLQQSPELDTMGGHADLITDPGKLDSFVINALNPMLAYPTADGYTLGSHPMVHWDIINEPEFAIAEFNPSVEGIVPVPQADMQRFVAVIADQIHRAGNNNVSVGQGGIFSISDNVRGGFGNIWADDILTQYAPLGYLDYYQPHYYSWMDGDGVNWDYNPLNYTAAELGLDKPMIIGEFSALDANQIVAEAYARGYAGAWGWSYEYIDGNGDWNTMKSAFVNFANANPEAVACEPVAEPTPAPTTEPTPEPTTAPPTVEPTPEPTLPPGPGTCNDPRVVCEAEYFTSQVGVEPVEHQGASNGLRVGFFNAGDSITFSELSTELSGAQSVWVRYSNGMQESSMLEISENGSLIAVVELVPTGNWNTYGEVQVSLITANATGSAGLFSTTAAGDGVAGITLAETSGQADIDAFEFLTTTSPVPPTPEPTAVPTEEPTPAPTTEPTPPPAPIGDVFLETFDGAPDQPTIWDDDMWDVTVHRRDMLFESQPFWADHTADCGAPPLGGPNAPQPDESNAHIVTDFDDHVFQCRNHLMTGLYGTAPAGDGYGALYMTPHLVVDVTQDFVIEWEISTMRTNQRDWFDVWVTSYDDNMMHPVKEWVPDLQAEPSKGFLVEGWYIDGMEMLQLVTFNDRYRDIGHTNYGSWDQIMATQGNVPERAQRTTFRIERSGGQLRIGMPDYDFWWYDMPVPADFDAIGEAVVQFGHHSYVPDKDCSFSQLPWSDRCGANTYHWDNMKVEGQIRQINAIQPIERDPAVTIVENVPEGKDGVSGQIFLEEAVPADAMLRFSARGQNMKVRFNGGEWVDATKQGNLRNKFPSGHFQSYWMPIPEGTVTIEFSGQDDWGGPWAVRDPAVWALGSAGAVADATPAGSDEFMSLAQASFMGSLSSDFCEIKPTFNA